MKFTKISATGNDFILFDNRKGRLNSSDNEFFRRICQRRLSVGADGILLINNSDQYDFSLLYFNSDGKIGEMCGNGARAAAYYAYHHNIVTHQITFDVLGVVYKAKVLKKGVKLSMPPPVQLKMKPKVVEEPFLQEGAYLNVGVPHYVLFADNIDNIDVPKIGRKYRYHQAFQPWGTNTNFVQICGKRKLKIRTYERGVEEETLACGTGTISSAIVANRQKGLQPPIEVEARGGTLQVNFDDNLKNVTLTGQVRIVYEGDLIDR